MKVDPRKSNVTMVGGDIDPATIDRRTQLPLRPGARAGAAGHQAARDTAEAASYGIGTVRWPRIVPKDPDCAESLKKRTLTNLYNQRPAWLDLAHQKLDAAVFAAYGWDPGISDEQLLEKLLP